MKSRVLFKTLLCVCTCQVLFFQSLQSFLSNSVHFFEQCSKGPFNFQHLQDKPLHAFQKCGVSVLFVTVYEVYKVTHGQLAISAAASPSF